MLFLPIRQLPYPPDLKSQYIKSFYHLPEPPYTAKKTGPDYLKVNVTTQSHQPIQALHR